MKHFFAFKALEEHKTFYQIPIVSLRYFIGILLVLFTLNLSAQATWNGGGVGANWNTAASWSGIIPAPSTNTLVNIPGNLIITANGLTNLPDTIIATGLELNGGNFTIPSGKVIIISHPTGNSDGVIINRNSLGSSTDTLTIDGKLVVKDANLIGVEVMTDGVLIVNDTLIVDAANLAGLSLESAALVDNNLSGTIILRGNGAQGIENGGVIENEGTLLITDSVSDGIMNAGGRFTNAGITKIFHSGGNGLENDGSTFFENGVGAILAISKTSQIGIEHGRGSIFDSFGLIAIDSTGDHGLFIDDDFNSMGDSIFIGTKHPCTGTGSGVGCEIGMNGINVASGGEYSVEDGSVVIIGGNCPIFEKGINNAGILTTDNHGTKITIRNTGGNSIMNTGMITHNSSVDGACIIIDVDNAIITEGKFDNNGIIITTAPTGISTGNMDSLDNNGFISDVNGTFLSSLTTTSRSVDAVVDTTDGIMIAPYHAADYVATITDYLISGLGSFTGFSYVIQNFSDGTLAGKDLTLNTVGNTFTPTYEIHNGEEFCASTSASIVFGSSPNDELACNGHINISLGKDGTATISPEMLLESTHANMANFIVEILSGSGAGTNVVDCSYLDQTVDVMITVPGDAGNRCWGRVTVEDKFAPMLMINDTTFYCNQPYAPETLGFPIGTDACSAPVTYTYADKDSVLTLCGEDASDSDTLRIITRTFIGRDQRWNATTITQTIYELRPTINAVVFPSSFAGADALQCNSNTSDAVTGRPYFRIGTDSIPVEASCKFGINVAEKIYDLGCPGKERIERTWTVMDWCNLSSGGAIATSTQIIDIVDTIPPTFDSIKASEIIILNTSAHKCMANIKPPTPPQLIDGCSGGAIFQILGPTGTIYNDPNDSLVNIPLGSHTLEYIMTDSCGNEVRDTIAFELRDETSPLAIAQELTINLVDGEGNTWVYASSFDAGSFDNCGRVDSIVFSKDGTNFAEALAFDCSDVGEITLYLRVFDEFGNFSTVSREVLISDTGGYCGTTTPVCDASVKIDSAFMAPASDCGLANGVLIINASGGPALEYSVDSGATYFPTDTFLNQDSSLKYVFVREMVNQTCITEYKKGAIIGGCFTLNSQAAIAGHIQNENGETVEAVNISIGGYEMAPAITGLDGSFMFEEIPLEGDYMITPEKDMNHINGITTFDIIILSKHILGLKKLDSPYKMIAADINQSGTISAYDMVLLRQVILGMKDDFSNNTSWRFIDADYEFLNPDNPFDENYPEAYEIKDLATDMMSLDFIAIKIGDLNNSAAVNQLQTTESRSTQKALNFQIAEQVKQANELVTVDFKASNFQSILGYQFTLDFDGNDLEFEQIKMGTQTNFENFNLSMIQRGIITTSWNESEAISLAEDEVLFSLVFKAKNEVRISEAVNFSSDITTAEAYTETEEVINVNLEVYTPHLATEGFKLYQNVPNPFTGETIIGFELPKASATTLTIFDMSGKTVKVEKGAFAKGYNQILLDGKAFDEYGMFYYQLETNQGIETKKMILLKR